MVENLWSPLGCYTLPGKLESLSRCLVPSIKEFKNRHRRKLRVNDFSCLKEKAQFRQARNLSIFLEEGDGEEERATPFWVRHGVPAHSKWKGAPERECERPKDQRAHSGLWLGSKAKRPRRIKKICNSLGAGFAEGKSFISLKGWSLLPSPQQGFRRRPFLRGGLCWVTVKCSFIYSCVRTLSKAKDKTWVPLDPSFSGLHDFNGLNRGLDQGYGNILPPEEVTLPSFIKRVNIREGI